MEDILLKLFKQRKMASMKFTINGRCVGSWIWNFVWHVLMSCQKRAKKVLSDWFWASRHILINASKLGKALFKHPMHWWRTQLHGTIVKRSGADITLETRSAFQHNFTVLTTSINTDDFFPVSIGMSSMHMPATVTGKSKIYGYLFKSTMNW